MGTPPKVYTRAEARLVLRIGKTKLDELIKAGRIKVIRPGRRVIIPEDSIHEYLRRTA